MTDAVSGIDVQMYQLLCFQYTVMSNVLMSSFSDNLITNSADHSDIFQHRDRREDESSLNDMFSAFFFLHIYLHLYTDISNFA